MQRLDAEEDAAEFARHLTGQEGRRADPVLEDRADDLQPVAVDGRHMLGDIVHQDHLVPLPQPGSAQSSADGPRPPDDDGIAHFQRPSISARVSSTAMSQIACISSSGRS